MLTKKFLKIDENANLSNHIHDAKKILDIKYMDCQFDAEDILTKEIKTYPPGYYLFYE